MSLVIITGPPAVGKMTVGHELASRTGLRLFHNHLTIELVLRFFEFGEPAFTRLVSEFRTRIFEEVAASALPGLIFTFVWDFDDPRDAEFIDRVSGTFRAHGAEVFLVELEATLEERLRRNETEFRLAEKPSKRDLEASRRRLLTTDRAHRLSSRGDLAERPRYLHLDTTAMPAAVAAERIIAAFGLPVLTPQSRG